MIKQIKYFSMAT